MAKDQQKVEETTEDAVVARLTMTEFLRTETDFEELINSLQFTEESVIQAAVDQPYLYIKAARARVQTMRARARAKAEVDERDAELAAEFRTDAQERGQKTTEKGIADQVLLDERMRSAHQKLRVAEAQEELGKLLMEAFRHRRDAIKVIAEAELVEGNSPHTDQARLAQSEKLERDRNSIGSKHRGAKVAAIEDGDD